MPRSCGIGSLPRLNPFLLKIFLFSAQVFYAARPAPGSNRTIVTTISPQTNLMAFSMMGGFLAPELKHAGYDKVILRGKSPEPGIFYG